MEDYLRVGVISSIHGVHGEVKLYPTTSDVCRFKELKEAYIDNNGEFVKVRAVGCRFFKQFVILKFKGYDDPDAIAPYKGMSLMVSRENAVKLNEDEYYIADIIGLKAEDDERDFKGIITDVIQTGANDVYVIKDGEGREVLVPAIKDCILDVDIRAGFMKIHILEGLLD